MSRRITVYVTKQQYVALKKGAGQVPLSRWMTLVALKALGGGVYPQEVADSATVPEVPPDPQPRKSAPERIYEKDGDGNGEGMPF